MLSDGAPASASLADASRVDKAHSERNAHRLFNRYGLALRVKISFLPIPPSPGHDEVSIPYLSMCDYATLLLKQHRSLLFGGLKGLEAERLCQVFWERFRGYQSDHLLYQRYSKEEWGRCVPIFLHGDKGRTLQKSPIFVMSFETPWSLPASMLQKCAYDIGRKRHMHDGRLQWSCEARQKYAGKRSHAEMMRCPFACSACLREEATGPQRHNSKGHSFLSRFLVAAVTSKMYKRNENALPGLLKQVASDMQLLFDEGIEEAPGQKIKFVLVGVKGDAEFHWEAASFTRSYHRTGVKNDAMICPHCEAGKPGLNFTDARDAPCWAASIGKSEPWNVTPPLNLIPFSARHQAFLYKFDPFHVLKFGVFRDAVASTIIRLALTGHFDHEGAPKGIEPRLERAFSLFTMWCLASKKTPGIKKFTKENMNFPRYRAFAWLNAKGSDVILVMCWLEWFLGHLLAKGESLLIRAMHQTLLGGLNYIGAMHSHGLFLPAGCARTQLDSGFTFLRGYLYLAQECMRLKVSGFRLRPKLHYFNHLLREYQDQLNQQPSFVLSSAAFLCEQNEDFIGRLSRTSRRVAARTAPLRTIQRYLVKMKALLVRLQK